MLLEAMACRAAEQHSMPILSVSVHCDSSVPGSAWDLMDIEINGAGLEPEQTRETFKRARQVNSKLILAEQGLLLKASFVVRGGESLEMSLNWV